MGSCPVSVQSPKTFIKLLVDSQLNLNVNLSVNGCLSLCVSGLNNLHI